MKPIKALIASVCAATALAANAQTPTANLTPYAGEQSRAIKALSEREVGEQFARADIGHVEVERSIDDIAQAIRSVLFQPKESK